MIETCNRPVVEHRSIFFTRCTSPSENLIDVYCPGENASSIPYGLLGIILYFNGEPYHGVGKGSYHDMFPGSVIRVGNPGSETVRQERANCFRLPAMQALGNGYQWESHGMGSLAQELS